MRSGLNRGPVRRMNDWRRWLPWFAAAWIVAATVWYFTRDLPEPTGSRAGVAVSLALVPEQLWADEGPVPSGWAGVWHGWRWVAWGTAVAVWLAAWLVGGAAVELVRIRGLAVTERLALSLGLGAASLSLAALLAGITGSDSSLRTFVWGLAGAKLCFVLLRAGRNRRPHPCRLPRNRKRLAAIALAVAPFLALMLLGATVPTMEFDAREYHLQGPKEWFLAGRIEPLPHNVYTRMPAGTEMLTLLCMHLTGDWRVGALAGQATLAGFVPLAALAGGCVARRVFGAGAGWFAAAAFLTCPWAVRLAAHPYAEGALCAYGTLALLAVVITLRRRRQATLRPALLAGLLAGAAFACKYPALLQIAAPAGIALAGASRTRRWVKLALFACGFAALAGPWLVKNLVETGNPVFPLLWSVLGGEGWDAATNARWAAAHSPPDWSPVRWPHWFGQPLGTDPMHTPLVIAFAPLAALVRPRRAAWLAAALGGLLLAWYAATHRLDRFWVPLLPAACVLAGAGLRWATADRPLPVVAGAWASAAVAALFNFALCVGGLIGGVPLAADPEAASVWVEEFSAPLIAALNDRFGPGDRVVLIGEAEVFGANLTPIYATVWNRPPLADPADPLPPGVAAVAVNWAEIDRYRAPGSYGFDPRVRRGFLDARVARGELAPPTVVRNAGGAAVGEIYAVVTR